VYEMFVDETTRREGVQFHATFGDISYSTADMPFTIVFERANIPTDRDAGPLTGMIQRGAPGFTFYRDWSEPHTYVLAGNSGGYYVTNIALLSMYLGKNRAELMLRELFRRLASIPLGPSQTVRVTTRGGPPAWLVFRYVVSDGAQ
jgi:hypothetical protein